MIIKKLIISSILLFVSGITYSQSPHYYIPYLDSGKYGYSDTAGNVVIAPQFVYAGFFQQNGYAFIYNSNAAKPYNDNSIPRIYRGLIDSKGHTIVPCRFASIDFSGNYMLTYNDAGKAGLYTNKGIQVFKNAYDYIGTEGHFASARDSMGTNTIVRYDYKKKMHVPVMKLKGYEVMLDYVAKNIIYVYNDQYMLTYDSLGKLKDKQGMSGEKVEAASSDYEDVIADFDDSKISSTTYYKDNLYGIVLRQPGQYTYDTFPALYSELIKISSLSNHIYMAKKGGKWGLINGHNEIVCPFEYDSAKTQVTKSGIHANSYLWEVCQSQYWGVYNTYTKSLLIPCKYNTIEAMPYPYAGTCYKLKNGNESGFALHTLDALTGLIEPKYTDVSQAQKINNSYFLILALDSQNQKFWVNLKGFEYRKQ